MRLDPNYSISLNWDNNLKYGLLGKISEDYFNFGSSARVAVQVPNDLGGPSPSWTNSYPVMKLVDLPPNSALTRWVINPLKVASGILTLGLIPLIMWIANNIFRANTHFLLHHSRKENVIDETLRYLDNAGKGYSVTVNPVRTHPQDAFATLIDDAGISWDFCLALADKSVPSEYGPVARHAIITISNNQNLPANCKDPAWDFHVIGFQLKRADLQGSEESFFLSVAEARPFLEKLAKLSLLTEILAPYRDASPVTAQPQPLSSGAPAL